MHGLGLFCFSFFFVFVGINTFQFPKETQTLLKANVFPLMKQYTGVVISGSDATNVAKGVGVGTCLLAFQLLQPMYASAGRHAAFLLFTALALVWHMTEKSVFDATNPKDWAKLATLPTGGYTAENEWKIVSTLALLAGLFGCWAGSVAAFRRLSLVLALVWVAVMAKNAFENPKVARNKIAQSAFVDAYGATYDAVVKSVPAVEKFNVAFAVSTVADVAGPFLLGLVVLVALTVGSMQQLFARLLASVLLITWVFTDLRIPTVNIIENPPSFADRYLILRNLALIGAILIMSTTPSAPKVAKKKVPVKKEKVQ